MVKESISDDIMVNIEDYKTVGQNLANSFISKGKRVTRKVEK